MADQRKRFDAWTYPVGFTFVALGYGVTVGLNLTQREHWNDWWYPVKFFKTAAYRGLR